jgi:hypothetical protein
MTLFGKSLSNYVAFCKFFLVLIPVVGIIRLALSLNGTPIETARWLSMSALVWIAVIYYSIRTHTTGFGSYGQLLVIVALINLTAQLVSIFGIVLAILTDTNNIYSAPEFAFGGDGKTWGHAAAHLFIGTIAGSLIPWLIGSLILFGARRMSGVPGQVSKTSI